MKSPREMTIAEIEYLCHSHEFPSEAERVKALSCLMEIIHIVDFIEERVNSYVPLPCDCSYCDNIRNSKPRASKPTKEKEPPVHFSLD